MDTLPVQPPAAVALPIKAGKIAPTQGGHAVISACITWYASMAKDNNALFDKLAEQRINDAEAMREALEGPNPSPIERLLVERVVVCHTALAAVEGRSYGLPVNIGECGHAHVDRLQKRYLDALKALAQVRRMKLPAAPVFVGGQHVHVEGG